MERESRSEYFLTAWIPWLRGKPLVIYLLMSLSYRVKQDQAMREPRCWKSCTTWPLVRTLYLPPQQEEKQPLPQISRPFAPQVGRRVVPIDEAVEMIDNGGLSLLAAAARNFGGVAVACDPADYAVLADELRLHGLVSADVRRRLAAKAEALLER